MDNIINVDVNIPDLNRNKDIHGIVAVATMTLKDLGFANDEICKILEAYLQINVDPSLAEKCRIGPLFHEFYQACAHEGYSADDFIRDLQ